MPPKIQIIKLRTRWLAENQFAQ